MVDLKKKLVLCINLWYAIVIELYCSPVIFGLTVCNRHVMNLESCLNHPVETDVNLRLFVLSLTQTAIQRAWYDFFVGQGEVPKEMVS